MPTADPSVTITEHDASIIVEWQARGVSLELRLDRVPASQPRWVGSAADLDGTGDRRGIPRVIDALTTFGQDRAESVALYHDDGRLEWLVEP